jgi:hypothetical protein
MQGMYKICVSHFSARKKGNVKIQWWEYFRWIQILNIKLSDKINTLEWEHDPKYKMNMIYHSYFNTWWKQEITEKYTI